MKAALSLLCAFLCFSMTLFSVDSTFLDYQNYNHGYCPECNCYPCRCDGPGGCEPCNTCAVPDPCNPAPVCGTQCGLSVCAVALAIIIVAGVAAIIISSSGSSHTHAANTGTN